MKAIVLSLVALLLLACGLDRSPEREAIDAKLRAERQAAMDQRFPRRMVLCEVETGKAYLATMKSMTSVYEFDYTLEEFPGPNWKCPTTDKKEKMP